MKSNDFLSEDIASDAHEMHLDHEVQMARKDCYAAADDAIALHKLLRNVSEQQGLEGWVAAKITLASDYLNTVREHLEYQLMSQVQPDSMEFTVAEGAMPATVIRVKEKIRLMSADEKKEYFRGKTREQLQKMARSHGYGENSDVYAKYATEAVSEGSEDLVLLKAKASKISDKIDAIVKDGGRVGLNDPLSKQLKSIRAKIQQAKKQSVAEDGGTSSAGAIASVNNPDGKSKSQVGSLFGGTYQRKKKTADK